MRRQTCGRKAHAGPASLTGSTLEDPNVLAHAIARNGKETWSDTGFEKQLPGRISVQDMDRSRAEI